jgi:hypothetical protein
MRKSPRRPASPAPSSRLAMSGISRLRPGCGQPVGSDMTETTADAHLEADHQLLSGCREDVLRQVNGAWKVSRRTIVLDADVLLDKNLSVFL